MVTKPKDLTVQYRDISIRTS